LHAQLSEFPSHCIIKDCLWSREIIN